MVAAPYEYFEHVLHLLKFIVLHVELPGGASARFERRFHPVPSTAFIA